MVVEDKPDKRVAKSAETRQALLEHARALFLAILERTKSEVTNELSADFLGKGFYVAAEDRIEDLLRWCDALMSAYLDPQRQCICLVAAALFESCFAIASAPKDRSEARAEVWPVFARLVRGLRGSK